VCKTVAYDAINSRCYVGAAIGWLDADGKDADGIAEGSNSGWTSAVCYVSVADYKASPLGRATTQYYGLTASRPPTQGQPITADPQSEAAISWALS